MHVRLLSVWLLLACSPLIATDGPDLTVSVDNITEHRHSHTNNYRKNTCRLEVTFAGRIAEQSMGVLELRVTKAENNFGEQLVLPKVESLYEVYWPYTRGTIRASSNTLPLEVRASLRQATSLTIEGEADFFQPSEESGSRVVVTNFIADRDTWLNSPELTKAGLKLMFVGRENHDAFIKGLREQKPGRYSHWGAINNPDPRKCALRFRIEGVGRKLVLLEVEDSTGNRHQPRGFIVTENYRIVDFAAPPPTDSRLILYLDIPEARKTIPFKLETLSSLNGLRS